MQKKATNSFKLLPSHYKVLFTVKFLNDTAHYPSSRGIYNILKCECDAETIQYSSLKTYGTMMSSSSKKITRQVNSLLKHDYLKYIYDKNSDALYLRLSNKGIDALSSLNDKKRFIFCKKISHRKSEIVKII